MKVQLSQNKLQLSKQQLIKNACFCEIIISLLVLLNKVLDVKLRFVCVKIGLIYEILKKEKNLIFAAFYQLILCVGVFLHIEPFSYFLFSFSFFLSLFVFLNTTSLQRTDFNIIKK